jgi:hypothetical protein
MAGRRRRRTTADDAGAFVAMDQAIAVLEALAERPDGLTGAELAAAIGVAPWTVERVVQSLHEARFVAGGAPRWRLSLRAVGLSCPPFATRTRGVVPARWLLTC